MLTVYNATHAHWAQILDEDESVLDQVWVTKGSAIMARSSQSTAKAGKRAKVSAASLRGRHE